MLSIEPKLMSKTETKRERASDLRFAPITSLRPPISGFLGKIDNLQGKLFEKEAAIVKNAVTKRKKEFTAGRSLARIALETLGLEDQMILQDDRAPVWPTPICGSITHCDSHCAVIAAPKTSVKSLGIDLEMSGKVGSHLWDVTFTDSEKEHLKASPAEEQDFLSTAMFGAKEAFYKLQHPLTGLWVGFEDVTVTINDHSDFHIDCRKTLPGIPSSIQGTIQQPVDKLILCMLWLDSNPY
jgi:4'-phosphopantetheinyl transferase EntD